MIGDSFSDAAAGLADALTHYAAEIADLPEPIQDVIRQAAASVDHARALIDWSQNHTHVNRYMRSGADVIDPDTLAKYGGYHRAERA